MSQGLFNPHAKILHDGQYRIKNTRMPVPIKNFNFFSNELDDDEKRIQNMRLEFEQLENQIAEKKKENQEKSSQILDQANFDAKTIVEQAEKVAFDKMQKSLLEKDEILEKAEQKSASLISNANKEAENILRTAQEDAEKIRVQAQKEGFDLGKIEGLTEGKSEIEFTVERLHSVVAETVRERERILVHSERQVINLVISMVKKIVKKLSVEHQEVVIENTKAALELLRGALTLFIRVSPKDFNFVQSFKAEFIRMIESRSELKFIEDPTVDPGGVYIETDSGDIDATIKSQLEEIEHQMRFYMPMKVKTPETKERESKKQRQENNSSERDESSTDFAKRVDEMNNEKNIVADVTEEKTEE